MPSNAWWHCGHVRGNLVQNLIDRDVGLLSPRLFSTTVNSNRLKNIRLSRYRSITPSSHSINWLSLDQIESRYLLAAKCDGNFVCVDMRGGDATPSVKGTGLKFLFDSSNFAKDAHNYAISCIQWYPVDSGIFFTSSLDQKFKVWDTNTLQAVDEYAFDQKIYNHHMSEVGASTTSSVIALALNNGLVRFIDLNSGSSMHTLKAHTPGYCVRVHWSPYDPNILATAGSDGRVTLWDVRSAKASLIHLNYELASSMLGTKRSAVQASGGIAHSAPVLGLTFTHDGHHILTLGRDNQMRLWNAHTGLNTLVNYGKIPVSSASLEYCVQITCTRDCTRDSVLIPSRNTLLLYNIHDGDLTHSLKGHFEAVNCAVYNDNSTEIYSGSKDRNILIWSPDEMKRIEEEERREKKSSGSTFNPYSLFAGGTSYKPPEQIPNRSEDNWSDED